MAELGVCMFVAVWAYLGFNWGSRDALLFHSNFFWYLTLSLIMMAVGAVLDHLQWTVKMAGRTQERAQPSEPRAETSNEKKSRLMKEAGVRSHLSGFLFTFQPNEGKSIAGSFYGEVDLNTDGELVVKVRLRGDKDWGESAKLKYVADGGGWLLLKPAPTDQTVFEPLAFGGLVVASQTSYATRV